MLNKTLLSGIVQWTLILGLASRVWGEGGVVQSASKAAAKGAVKGVQQQLSPGEIVNRAKDVTKGVADGVADAVPRITSQFLNQVRVNRNAVGQVAREASAAAVAGALDATTRELGQTLGPSADRPLAEAIASMTERTAAAATRGLVSELHMDPSTMETLTAAAVRGAVSEMHFHVSIWPLVLAFTLGGVSTLLCSLGLMLLYLLFDRRHPSGAQATLQITPASSR